MSRFKPAAGTHRRPMAGWWRSNPFFVRYMLREGSALFLSIYALVLLLGLLRLAQGEAAFDGWRAALATPWSVAFHAVALGFVGYHSLTWFGVMPKTAHDLRLDPKWITIGGLAGTALLSALILAALVGLTR